MKVLLCVSALLVIISGKADPYYSNGYQAAGYLAGPLAVTRYMASMTGGAAISGNLISGPTNGAGENSGSFSIKSSNGYKGEGTFTMNVHTGTMKSLTFGGQSIITSGVSGGLRVAPPGTPGHPFSVSWTAKPTGHKNSASGTFSVFHKNGHVDSGTFNFNLQDLSKTRVTFNGQDISNVFSGSLPHFG